jgi:predicted phosphodiesterase
METRFKNRTNADVLILAGDIAEFNHYPLYDEFFWFLSTEYKHILIVAGNHEFYNWDLTLVGDIEHYLTRFNVKFLNRTSTLIGDVRFIGATLWTNYNHEDPMVILRASGVMNDYVKIQCDGRPLLPDDILGLHYKDTTYIKNTISQYQAEDSRKVLITHHAPSLKSVHGCYLRSRDYNLNFAYCSDLLESGCLQGFDVMIHGHTHHKLDYVHESTRVLCNPLGYPDRYYNYMDPLLDDEFYLDSIEV